MFRVVGLLALPLMLWGCATSAPPAAAVVPDALYADARFGAPSERIDVDRLFELSDPMRRFLDDDLSKVASVKGRQQALVDALHDRRRLRLDYDARVTRSAAGAFEARSGNCLSLVIMTAAFAKAMSLPVEYRRAVIDETWSRSGDLILGSNHVNLTLGTRLIDHGTTRARGALTIDFLPPDEAQGLRTVPIEERTVVAMYLNNRAAEALVEGQVDDAYWAARASVERDPSFVAAVNTLGVVYLRKGEFALAERAFRTVLAREPQHTRAMGNLAQVLGRSGRPAEQAAVLAALERLEPHPPFHFYQLGRDAMERGDYPRARALFAKEVGRAEYNHEFQYWLAVAHFRLGEFAQARKHLALAAEYSPQRGEQQRLYGAKLAWLQRHRGAQ